MKSTEKVYVLNSNIQKIVNNHQITNCSFLYLSYLAFPAPNSDSSAHNQPITSDSNVHGCYPIRTTRNMDIGPDPITKPSDGQVQMRLFCVSERSTGDGSAAPVPSVQYSDLEMSPNIAPSHKPPEDELQLSGTAHVTWNSIWMWFDLTMRFPSM